MGTSWLRVAILPESSLFELSQFGGSLRSHSLLERNERAWEGLFVASLGGRSQNRRTPLLGWRCRWRNAARKDSRYIFIFPVSRPVYSGDGLH